jgi:Reverse transcriptase (RNA-dependent DNA polymerase)/WD40-like Beta Propeller Repeat
MGLPVGPDTSFILAELIATKVDEGMDSDIGPLTGVRYVDDFHLYFDNRADSEAGYTSLTRVAKQYELEVNDRKTEIFEGPDTGEPPWKTALKAQRIYGKNELQRSSLSSTREQREAQYSPDGQHIVFCSTRAGSAEIWMSDADGNNLVQLSKLNGNSGTPRWSPGGKKIVFDLHRSGHFEIYIEDVSERAPRKLVTNLREDVSTPSWSHDGKWIYFRSYEAVGSKIYRCAATGGDTTLLSAQPDAISPQESYDGNFLYFAARLVNAGLRMILLNHASTESAVEGTRPVYSEGLWTVVPAGIYFVPADIPRSLCYFDFASRKIREVFHLEKDFAVGLSVSPDGRWLLYSRLDEQNSDIMLIDQFR